MKSNIYPIRIGRIEFKTEKDLMGFTPEIDNWSYCDGNRCDESMARLVCSDGESIPVEYGGYDGTASNHVPDWRGDGETIAQAIARAGSERKVVVEVEVHDFYSCSFDDIEDVDEKIRIPISKNKIDWSKLRRRIEDRLRKDTKAVFLAANVLNLDFPLNTDIDE